VLRGRQPFPAKEEEVSPSCEYNWQDGFEKKDQKKDRGGAFNNPKFTLGGGGNAISTAWGKK